MSIATKTGDNGTTGLMYNRRVSKCHPRVEAYGTMDELNTALGMAKACSSDALIREFILATQADLVVAMGELATLPEDLPRYAKDGFRRVEASLIDRLDGMVRELESRKISFKGWATPGATIGAATLDVARTACRRAERRAAALAETEASPNPSILIYLNRLSDALWLLARWAETREPDVQPTHEQPAKT
ncbi:MAG: cob(I)yrinic acid a,c-diamide adenosyltransferase [Verrucomicrobia bacterium]|nr:cob(I)yrinic acid a,c-diamide adenosyltransferase [Verrucomicrobiota bacterium]MBI3871148.1 cob(I)yrinic acid a,c-diamide adenosyltransferase [Verrucomicrobiota bacterium]